MIFFYVVNKTLNSGILFKTFIFSNDRWRDVFCFNSDRSYLDGIKKENNNEKCFFMFNKIFFMWWIGHLVSCLQWVTFYKRNVIKIDFIYRREIISQYTKYKNMFWKYLLFKINIFSVLGVHVHNIHLPVGEKFTQTFKQKTRSVNLVSRLSCTLKKIFIR